MSKEINIHVKTTGVEQAKQDFTGLAEKYDQQLTSFRLEQYQATASAKQHTEELKNQDTALGRLGQSVKNYGLSWLSFTAILSLVIAGVRRVITAFDDMKKAASDAVHELANQQRTAASFFEAMDAYSGPQRRAALAQAHGVQARTGLPFEESKQLIEAQKRTFGQINPQATDQFAAYWAIHGQNIGATTDLMRWMGESGIKTPERQGQIMRMIGVVAKQNRLKDEDIITAIAARGERFRYMGWTPEQTITNIGKALSGLSPTEAGKAMRGMFESLEGFTEEKALELKAPPKIAASEQARLEWLQTKAAAMPPEQRRGFLHKIFGPSAPYITKMLFEPTPPEMKKELEYATTPAAAAEEQRRFAEWQKTEEARLEMTKGKAVVPGAGLTPAKETEVLIREQGKAYLENYLRIADRLKYEKIKAFTLGPEYEAEMAAFELWKTTPAPKKAPWWTRVIPFGPTEEVLTQAEWEGAPLEERLTSIEKGAQNINIHYHNETIYTPRVGSDERGPRTPADIK